MSSKSKKEGNAALVELAVCLRTHLGGLPLLEKVKRYIVDLRHIVSELKEEIKRLLRVKDEARRGMDEANEDVLRMKEARTRDQVSLCKIRREAVDAWETARMWREIAESFETTDDELPEFIKDLPQFRSALNVVRSLLPRGPKMLWTETIESIPIVGFSISSFCRRTKGEYLEVDVRALGTFVYVMMCMRRSVAFVYPGGDCGEDDGTSRKLFKKYLRYEWWDGVEVDDLFEFVV